MRTQIFGPTTPIWSLVARPAESVDAGSTLGEVAIAMRLANVSALLVEGEGREGIVTERDLTRALAAGLGPDDRVSIVTSVHPIRVQGEMSILEAAALMLNEEVRHLVIEQDGTRGVVSLREVMAVLLQAVSPHIWLDSLRIALLSSRPT